MMLRIILCAWFLCLHYITQYFFVKENVLFHPYMPIFEASMSIIVDFEELYVQISVSAKMRYNLILAEYDL